MKRLDPQGLLSNPDRWLNDNIIDLRLHLMALDLGNFSDLQSEDIYIFGCYLYTKLIERDPTVLRWAKGVDLFSKKLIFVPINEVDSHWRLAVIVNPGLCSVRLGSDSHVLIIHMSNSLLQTSFSSIRTSGGLDGRDSG